MRNLFIIAILLVAAFMAGWFKIQRDGEHTTIEINRAEIRGDAKRAIGRGKDFLDRRDQQYDQQQYVETLPGAASGPGYDPQYDRSYSPPYAEYAPQGNTEPQPNAPPFYPGPVEYSGQADPYQQSSPYPRR